MSFSRMKKLDILTHDEISVIENNRNSFGKTGVTEYFAGLAGRNPDDPLRRQFVPDIRELDYKSYENIDPLCDKRYSMSERIINRYGNRILFLATGRCAMYCRHCFRKYPGSSDLPDFTKNDADKLLIFLKQNRSVKEVLVSGGDPLMVDCNMLEYLFQKIRSAGDDILIRIGTRIPVVMPGKIDNLLVSVFERYRPVFIFTQFNHEREITDKSAAAVELFLKKGIPVFNQTVLLRGINNTADDLKTLFLKLCALSVKPYYLFQGDLASGTSHFRTPLLEGLEIMDRLKSEMSLLTLPAFAVDLPEGGGKIILDKNTITGRKGGFFYLRNSKGLSCTYPDEA